MNQAVAMGAGLALGLAGVIYGLAMSGDAPAADPALAARVAQLEQRVAELEKAPRGRGAMAATADGRRGRARMREPAAGSRGLDPGVISDRVLDTLDSDDPDVQERVSSVVRDAMEAEREERRALRRERMEERALERLDEFAADAGLDDGQKQRLGEVLSGEREQIWALFTEARASMDFEGAREAAEGVRLETESAAAELLSDQQLEAFRSMRDEERERWGGRR